MLTVWSLLACSGGETETPAPPDATDESEHGDLTLQKPTEVVRPPPAPSVVQPGEPAAGVTSDMCDDMEDGGEVAGPDCITGTLTCGDTVIGHTLGGTERFDTRFYEKHHCTPATTRHDGGDERVYLLEIPPGPHRATVYLDTPCVDLDMAAIKVEDPSTCPTVDARIRQCEMWPKPGTGREKVELASNKGATWLIVVEGKAENEGAFSITVDCVDHL